MQLLLSFHSENSIVFPLAYRQYIQGVVYRALKLSYEELHDGGYVYSGKAYKLFTFGQLCGNYTIKGKTICFTDTVNLEIRSHDSRIILSLIRFFEKGSKVMICSNFLTVVECRLYDERIFSSHVKIRAVSPLVSYVTENDDHTIFFSPDDDEFYRLLMNNAKRKYLSCHKTNESAPEIEITSVGTPFKKQVTSFKTTYITGYLGELYMKSSPEMISFLYDTGLGAKNSQGFGMFSITELLN